MAITLSPAPRDGERGGAAWPAEHETPGVLTAWRHSPTAVLGTVIVALVLGAALCSLVWTPDNPLAIAPGHAFAGPSAAHLLGTDYYGRDVLSRLMAGAPVTLYAAAGSVAIAAAVGIPAGLYAAQRGGVPGQLVMRLADLIYAFPALLAAVVLAADFGASTLTAVLAIGIAFVPVVARVVRSGALQVLSADYVAAARAYGRSRTAVAIRHVLPNCASLIVVQCTLLFSVAILADAALSYLGLGTPPPTPTWGRMLERSQQYLSTDPLLSLWSGLAIACTVLGFNLLGDGLRDVLEATRSRPR
jgi:peptide/nickel transport system permease protein